MARLTRIVQMALCGSLLLMAGPALADAIDGEWCHADGRHLTIDGPKIVTPGGAHLTGNYDRHGFAYMAQAPEPDGGETIIMILLNETTMRMKAPSNPDQVWKRCSSKPVT
ncbi:MAG: hypothetical protein ACHQK9_20990 [Reyranellales bacterium]